MSWSSTIAQKLLKYSVQKSVAYPFYLFENKWKGILYDSERRPLALALLCGLVYYYTRTDMIEELLLQWGPCEHTVVREENGLVYLHIKLDTEDIVVFKGSSTIQDFITDVDMMITDDIFNISGKMHKGFHNMLFMSNQHMKIIENMKSKKLTLSGHSLGAALATLMSAFIKSNMIMNLTLVTFGCPRVGDRKFSANIHGCFYKNGSDVVTCLPLPPWYWHSCAQIQIGRRSINFSVADHHISNYISNL